MRVVAEAGLAAALAADLPVPAGGEQRQVGVAGRFGAGDRGGCSVDAAHREHAHQDEREQRWLFPSFRVELFRDDAEGYHLNLTSPAPCWFVMWRLDEDDGTREVPLARPVAVSLSYHDAGRWLDAQETVEQVPAAPEVLEVLRAFVAAHYQPEPKRRKRPQSFQPLQDRFGNPASVSTDKQRGGGAGRGGVDAALRTDGGGADHG